MKRVIRRIVTVVTTETWTVVDDEYDQADQAITVPTLGPAKGTEASNTSTAPDSTNDDGTMAPPDE